MAFFDTDLVLFIASNIEISLIGLIAIGALVYILLIACTPRLHSINNAITANFALSAIVFSLIYIVYFAITYRTDYFTHIYVKNCLILNYISPFANGCVVYALGVVSINRLCAIVFHNRRFFKTARWLMITLIFQWAISFAIPLPNIFVTDIECVIRMTPYWHRIYAIATTIIIPLIVFGSVNIMIFVYVRKSSRRVQTERDQPQNSIFASRRDIQLVKNMLFMFLLFTIGWAPTYIIRLLNAPSGLLRIQIDYTLTLLPVISLLINIIVLFYTNREVTNRLREITLHRVVTVISKRTNTTVTN